MSTPSAVVLGTTPLELHLAGGKGASLSRMTAWGLPVPPTAVVTTEAYLRVVADPGVARVVDAVRRGQQVPTTTIDEAFTAARSERRWQEEVLAAAHEIGAGGALAVRSSATVEDLAASSFAGQYTSVLDVDPGDDEAVVAAVLQVFASLWHPAPCAYRRAFGIAEHTVAMAVVLMRMVPARTAGVVFTVDPGGMPGAARVEEVSGLGESLVSGRRTPEPYVLDRDEPDPAAPAEVRDALELSLRLEHLEGRPQDVEWAWDGSRTWLVQGRPITVAGDEEGDGFDDAPVDHVLTTAAIDETLPGVLPPLRWQLASHLLDEAFRRLLDDLAVLGPSAHDEPLVRRVRGRAVLDFTVLRALTDELPGGVGAELEQQYFGSRREGRPIATQGGHRGLRRHLAHDLRVLAARRRVVQDADAVWHATSLVLAAPPTLEELEVAQLLAYRSRLLDLAVRAMADELVVAAVAASAHRRLEGTLVRHLGVDAAAAAAQRVVAASGVTVVPHRSASASVVAGPTWSELGVDPPVVQRSTDADPLEVLEHELDEHASWRSSELRHFLRVGALRRTVADTVAQLRRRERTKAAVFAAGGELRRVHLELGRRLVSSDALARPQDVELLSDTELRRALCGDPPPRATLARRARWIDRYEAEGPLPARFSGTPERGEVDLPEGDRLEGWATSPGRATGTAQVVRSPTGPFRAGNVLVAGATDASWSPLFVDAAAIVLERGGPLSHAAILARELGVPAVLNVPGATRLDGERVTVDGDAGVVVLEPGRPR